MLHRQGYTDLFQKAENKISMRHTIGWQSQKYYFVFDIDECGQPFDKG